MKNLTRYSGRSIHCGAEDCGHEMIVDLYGEWVLLKDVEPILKSLQSIKDEISIAINLLRSVNPDNSDSYHNLNNAIITLQDATMICKEQPKE